MSWISAAEWSGPSTWTTSTICAVVEDLRCWWLWIVDLEEFTATVTRQTALELRIITYLSRSLASLTFYLVKSLDLLICSALLLFLLLSRSNPVQCLLSTNRHDFKIIDFSFSIQFERNWRTKRLLHLLTIAVYSRFLEFSVEWQKRVNWMYC